MICDRLEVAQASEECQLHRQPEKELFTRDQELEAHDHQDSGQATSHCLTPKHTLIIERPIQPTEWAHFNKTDIAVAVT